MLLDLVGPYLVGHIPSSTNTEVGVHATLFFQVVRLLYPRLRYRREQLLLGYVSVVFILSNIANGANLKFGEMVFINNRGMATIHAVQ